MILADGEWHTMGEIVAAIDSMVRPESAFAAGWHRSGPRRAGRTRDSLSFDEVQCIMRQGVQSIVRSYARSSRRLHGQMIELGIETAGEYGNKRMRWRPVTRHCLDCGMDIVQSSPLCQRVKCEACVKRARSRLWRVDKPST